MRLKKFVIILEELTVYLTSVPVTECDSRVVNTQLRSTPGVEVAQKKVPSI